MQQFIEMFLPEDEEYVEVDEKEDADICFYSIQLEDEDLLRKNEKNVFFSIENFQVGLIISICKSLENMVVKRPIFIYQMMKVK